MGHGFVDVFFYVILKLKENRPYLHICRFFCLTMVTIGAIGCTGEWVTAWDPTSATCTAGKYACYQGLPLTLTDFVFNQGASPTLFIIPVIYLLTAFLLLFKPPKTYTILFILVILMFVAEMHSDPKPYIQYLSGTGRSLNTMAMAFIVLLSIPMVINELADPDFLDDFEKANQLHRVKDRFDE